MGYKVVFDPDYRLRPSSIEAQQHVRRLFAKGYAVRVGMLRPGQPDPETPKRKVSASARRKMAAAQKARWVRIKAAKK